MATLESYTQNALAEDFIDEIFLVSPVDGPVISMSKQTTATGRLHEFTQTALRTPASNKHVEGADAPAATSTILVERNNNCQIFSDVCAVSGTLEEVDKYGRSSEMSLQMELSYAALVNDQETAVMGAPGGTRQTGDAGDASTARELASFHNQVAAGVTIDSATSNAGGAITTTEMLESDMLDCHQAVYQAGGTPSHIIVNPAISRYVSAFAYSAGRSRDFRNESTIVNTVDLYRSSFGELLVVIDRNQDDCLALMDFEYCANATLRATHDYSLAKIGDSIRRQIIREGTWCLLNDEACGLVDNIPLTLTYPS